MLELNMKTRRRKRMSMASHDPFHDQRGSTLIQVLIVLAVVGIVSAFAFMRIQSARDSFALQNSMRMFAGRIEKARLDAIRRHGQAFVEFTANNQYAITMDFDGNGTTPTRTFSLEPNIALTNADGSAIAVDDLPTFDFGWRGGTPQCFTSIRMQNGLGQSSNLAVTSSGDVTIDTNLGATVSPGTFSSISQTSDIAARATVAGTSPASCDDPCGSCIISGGGVVSSPPSGCTAFTLNNSSITIRRNGAGTGSFTASVINADSISITQPDGRTNLLFTPSSQSIGANGSASFTVKSKNNSTGKFPVKFTSACSSSNSAAASVTVTK
jgi:type II secretory pathway pseudopilin PulG